MVLIPGAAQREARAVMQTFALKGHTERTAFATNNCPGSEDMSRKNRLWVWWCAAASGAVLAASFAAPPIARAQDAETPPRLNQSARAMCPPPPKSRPGR